MQFAVAVVAPVGYVHSQAFREVAEALHYGLRALGHDSLLTTRLDYDDRHTIVLGSNVLASFGWDPPKKPILYNLEQVGDSSPEQVGDSSPEQVGDSSYWITPAQLTLFRRYPVWDYSRANIEQLAARGISGLTHVPIGYVPQLTRIVPAAEDIDVLFYGVYGRRRQAVLNVLRAKGFRVESVNGVFGAARDALIARSKIVLNIHVYEAKVLEIVRISYLLANRRAVVSEPGGDPTEESDLLPGIAFADYDELVDRCAELLSEEGARREIAQRGYDLFSARSQSAILDEALASTFDTSMHVGG
jgi:rhodanese-related sulfurtransferase